jgi:cysteine synthase
MKEDRLMQQATTQMPVSSTLDAIGNTPLVKLSKVVAPNSADVYMKLEYYNPTGSYKDRMALAMIEEAEKRGDLRPGMTVVEYTGGSTGSSLAFVCAVKGYPIKIVSSDAFAQEKLRMMRAFGADLTLVPSEGGKITPDLIPRMIEVARELAAQGETYWTNQFHNADAQVGYAGIGREIIEQLNGKIDLFCGGVGTAGMLVGVSGELHKAVPTVRVVALEPASSPLLSQGRAGTHRVEGIGTGFLPPMLKREDYDEARGIDEGEARQMAVRLAKDEGIFAGISSGLNATAAVQLARELGPGHTVVTVAVDSGMKYLAGDLFSDGK